MQQNAYYHNYRTKTFIKVMYSMQPVSVIPATTAAHLQSCNH